MQQTVFDQVKELAESAVAYDVAMAWFECMEAIKNDRNMSNDVWSRFLLEERIKVNKMPINARCLIYKGDTLEHLVEQAFNKKCEELEIPVVNVMAVGETQSMFE